MLRLAAARQGFELTADVANPLEGLSPEAIAELLAIVCPSCASARQVKTA